MNKKKILIASLPLLGALVIVGVGYSAFVFNAESSSRQVINGTINIHSMVGDVNIESKLPETFTLELDQGGAGNTNANDGITTNLNSNSFQFIIHEPDNMDYQSLSIGFYYSMGIVLDYDEATDASKMLDELVDKSSYYVFSNGNKGSEYLLSDGTSSNPITLNQKSETISKSNIVYNQNDKTYTVTIDMGTSVFKYNNKPTDANDYNMMVEHYKDLENKNPGIIFDVGTVIIDK